MPNYQLPTKCYVCAVSNPIPESHIIEERRFTMALRCPMSNPTPNTFPEVMTCSLNHPVQGHDLIIGELNVITDLNDFPKYISGHPPIGQHKTGYSTAERADLKAPILLLQQLNILPNASCGCEVSNALSN
nr:hypothetical protein HmN_000233900 [Hymenolepis microstoma]